MNWNELNSVETLKKINELSEETTVLIFKHSTRCSISSMALDRLERNWKDSETKNIKPYYLDLIAHRDISSRIAELYRIPHESPQALLISKGKCIYDASHSDISYNDLKGK
jgi:bacillithiol system protein YtxJ